MLFKARWGEQAECPHCGQNKRISFLKTRKIYKCLVCKKQFSLTKGTVFENSNLPLNVWFGAIYRIATDKSGVSSVQLAKDLEIEQCTAWYMLQKLRAVMNEDQGLLKGIVEIDETVLGASEAKDKRLAFKIRKKKKLRIRMEAEGEKEKIRREEREAKNPKSILVKKNVLTLSDVFMELPYLQRQLLREPEDRNIFYQPHICKKNVVGIVERDVYDENGNLVKLGRTKLIRMGRHKTDIRRSNVEPFVIDHVHKSAHMMTDDNRIYWRIGTNFKKHSIIKHSKKGTNQQYAKHVDGEVSTNCIDNLWKQLKKVENGTYIHYSWKYTQLYLDAFSFRFNRRKSKPHEMFRDLLEAAIGKSVSRADLWNMPGGYIYYPR